MSAEVHALFGQPVDTPDTGSAAGDVVEYLRRLADAIATGAIKPSGMVVVIPSDDGMLYVQRSGLDNFQAVGALTLATRTIT